MEIQRHRGLPGSRAVVGGALIALAAVGVYLAYDQATDDPSDPVVVAARDIHAGEILDPEVLGTIEADLPDPAAGATFGSIEVVEGRVALAPIAAGEIVQAGAVTDGQATPDLHEVAISLPRGADRGRPAQGGRASRRVRHLRRPHQLGRARGRGRPDRRRRRRLAHEQPGGDARRRRALRRRGRRGRPRPAHRRRHRRAVDLRRCHRARIRSCSRTRERRPPRGRADGGRALRRPRRGPGAIAVVPRGRPLGNVRHAAHRVRQGHVARGGARSAAVGTGLLRPARRRLVGRPRS